MRPWSSVVLVLILFGVFTHAAKANEGDYNPNPHPKFTLVKRSGEIKIDGDLSDSGWTKVEHLTTFTTASPKPFVKPVVETEGLVTYDEENLYIAMIAHDPDPSQIRAHMRPRDRMFSDDFMGIFIDTYGDAGRAFEVYVNPLGVQGDLLWGRNNEDDSYDIIFESESKITADGWQMEMRIPFSSLRFPAIDVQNFRATFWRSYPRDQIYKLSWAPISFYDPCVFCQLGYWDGVTNIHSSRGLELLPSFVARNQAFRSEPADRLISDTTIFQPSLGLAYAFGANASLEATINPDFSQVEADAVQIDVNSTTALFYPERRPFFQEGSDLFNTFLDPVYTRTIRDPLAATKVVYRIGSSNLAFLSAYDRHSPVIIPLEDRTSYTDGDKSFSNVLRFFHPYGEDGFFGAIATDRRYVNGTTNTVAGIDGKLKLYENAEIVGQLLGSHTKESNVVSIGTDLTRFDQGKHTLEANGESFPGYAAYLGVHRFTRSLDLEVEYFDYSPTFRALNGFVTLNDKRNVTAWAGYKHPIEESFINEIAGGIVGKKQWNYAGARKLEVVRPFLDIDFKGQTSLHGYYRWYNEGFEGKYFTGLEQYNFRAYNSALSGFEIGIELNGGTEIARNIEVPRAGYGRYYTVFLNLKPFSALSVEPRVDYARLDTADEIIYSGAVYYCKLAYQFNRELDLRVVVQYDGFGKALTADPLITYRLNPFSIFYLGSTHGFTDDESHPNRFIASDRSIFAKFQYLFAI